MYIIYLNRKAQRPKGLFLLKGRIKSPWMDLPKERICMANDDRYVKDCRLNPNYNYNWALAGYL